MKTLNFHTLIYISYQNSIEKKNRPNKISQYVGTT